MTRPHADIETVDQLLAAGPERWVAIAAWAKTRVKTRGVRAMLTLSQVELAAMVLVLDVHLIDHPDVTPPAPPRQPAGAPDAKGLEL